MKNEDKFRKNHLSNRNTVGEKSTVVWQQQLSKRQLTPNHERYSQLVENQLTVHSEIIDSRQIKPLIDYNNSDRKITTACQVHWVMI